MPVQSKSKVLMGKTRQSQLELKPKGGARQIIPKLEQFT
jgi:hypothetical protein